MMKRVIFFAIALFVGSMIAAASVDAQSDTMRLKQFIAPIECTEEVVDNGVTTTQVLSPEECDELLHPKPPDSGGSEPNKPTSPTVPKKPTKPSDSNTIDAPNTGWQRRIQDAVYESGIVPILLAVGAVIFIRKIRKIKG